MSRDWFKAEITVQSYVALPILKLYRTRRDKVSLFRFAGGFDGTSNVLAGKLFNIPVKGTHAHAYVTSFTGAEDLVNSKIVAKDDPDRVETDFYAKCVEWRSQLAGHLRILKEEAHDGELAAFASYAVAFPDGFLALVDTYDVSR